MEIFHGNLRTIYECPAEYPVLWTGMNAVRG